MNQNVVLIHGIENQIVDINASTGAINLLSLNMQKNQIMDISPLSDLINLTNIDLDDNQVIYIYQLTQNSELGSGDNVSLFHYPLSTTSINTYIPQLQTQGVNVHY